MKRLLSPILLLLSLILPAYAADKKALKVYIEGDTTVIARMIQSLRDRQEEYGFEFTFVENMADAWDIRIVLAAEGTGLWNYAQGSAIVLNKECRVLAAVMRSNRLTAKGSTNAVAKEVIKNLHQFYGTKTKD